MVYRGEVKRYRPKLGVKPTAKDHAFVAALSLMGMGVRELCRRLGERFNLGKPMSRMTLYHHFRGDIAVKAKGRPPKRETLNRRVEANISAEMQRLIAEAKRRARS